VTTAVVHGILRGRKAWVGERANRHSYPLALVPFFGVEHRRSANRTEPEPELRPLISSADELCGSAGYLVWRQEARECGEYAPGSALTCQAMADAYSLWVALNFDAQLAAVAGGSPLFHEHLSGRLSCRLTLDMSGGWKRAKHAGRRPLDGGVRRHFQSRNVQVSAPSKWRTCTDS